MNKRIFIIIFFISVCLIAVEFCADAADLRNEYDIDSPEYVEKLSCTQLHVPFMITAPKGWYMILAKKPSNPLRAAFFKYNPEEVLSHGVFAAPSIQISFCPRKGKTAMEYALYLVAYLEKEGISILTLPEEITVDNSLGSHFVSSHIKGIPLTVDNYVFIKGDIIININAQCEVNKFEETKKEIKEAIDSIKFSVPAQGSRK